MLSRIAVATLVLQSVIAFSCNGQRVIAGLNVGYATFRMSDLKDFQVQIRGSYGVEMRQVETFPGYMNFSGNLLFGFKKFYVGVLAGHTSTGGRLHYSDYSGSMTSDQLVRMNYIGHVIGAKINRGTLYEIFLGGTLLYYKNTLLLEERLQVGNEDIVMESDYTSENIATGPFIEVRRNLGRFLLRATAGAELHIPTPLSSSDEQLGDSEEGITVQPGGLRINVGVAYKFKMRGE